MSAKRTGPQGTTMEDVRRAAGVTKPAPLTRRAPSMRMALPVQDIVTNLVGGPSPAYGKKYGGLPTAEQFQQLLIGSIDPFIQARQLAAAQAAQNRADLAAQTRFQPRTPQDYDRLRAEQEAVSNLLARPLSPAMPAQIDRRAELAARKAAIGDLEGQLAGTPGFMADAGDRTTGLREDIRMMRRATDEVPSNFFTRALAEQQAAEQAKAEAYGRAMERMNAVTMAPATTRTYIAERGPYAGTPQTVREASWQDVAAARLGSPVTGAQAAEQTAAQQTASALGELKASDLAQQIAIQRFGVDPALASGMLGPEFNRDIMIRQMGEQGVFPDQSIEEYIGMTQGPDALAAYQADRVQAALDKQAEGFRTADEEAYDLQLERATGISVDQAAGQRSRAVAREYLAQPNFVDYVNQGRTELLENPQITLEEQRNQAKRFAQSFYDQTGDYVGAEILLNALLSFDFTMAFEPLENDLRSRLAE